MTFFVVLERYLLLKLRQTFITEFKQSIFFTYSAKFLKACVMKLKIFLILHIVFAILSESFSNFPYLF